MDQAGETSSQLDQGASDALLQRFAYPDPDPYNWGLSLTLKQLVCLRDSSLNFTRRSQELLSKSELKNLLWDTNIREQTKTSPNYKRCRHKQHINTMKQYTNKTFIQWNHVQATVHESYKKVIFLC